MATTTYHPTLLLALADPERRATLQRRLVATGITVSAPESGVEAQRQVTGGAYALQILDTGMNGLEVQPRIPGPGSDGAAIVLLYGSRDLTPGDEALAGTRLVLPADLPDESLVDIAVCLLAEGQRLAKARETAGQLREVFEEAKQHLHRVESEHNESEQHLQKLRQRFHRLIDANPAMIYATGVAGEHRCRFVSRRLTDLFGYMPQQMVGNDCFWLDHIHPEDRERVLAELEHLLAAGSGVLNYRFRHAEGGWRWLRDDFAVLRDNKGQAQEIIGCCSDISTEIRAKAHFENIFQTVLNGILLVDTEGVIRQANPALARIFGYPGPGEMEGKPLADLLPASLREGHAAHLAKYFSHPSQRMMGSGLRLEGQRADGSLIPLDISLAPFEDPADGPIKALAIVQDVSNLRARDQRIEDLLRAYTLLSAVNQAVVGIDEAQVLLETVCRIAVEEGTYPLAWVGLLDGEGHWLQPVASAGESGYLQGIRVSARNEDPEGQGSCGQAIRSREAVVFENLQADSHFAPWREAAQRHGLQSSIALPLIVEGETIGLLSLYATRPQRFSGEELVLLTDMASDLSFGIEHIGREARRRNAETHLKALAYNDELTGLYNRVGFLQAVNEASASGTPLALAVFELERLREINQSFGYSLGDAVLRGVASRLQKASDDVILGHFGTSIFAVLLPRLHTEGAAIGRLESLLSELHEPFDLGGAQVVVQCRVGLAMAPRDGLDPELLLRRADLAKDAAKAGVGIGCYRAEMEPDPDEQAMLARLVRGVGSEQFHLHYQPKMDLSSGRISEVEALVRWQDPDAGLQPPGRFIPLLEKTGLMTRLTPQLLAEAAAVHARWLARGLDIGVAVNISAADLSNRSLPEQVHDACISAGTETRSLLLELTETAVLQVTPVVTENLAALDRLGVKLSIDDFGTGHASLSRLVDLPVSQIKIDQSFVTPMIRSANNRLIVEAAIDLGQRLGLEVVAEGIEDEDTLALLREMGCDKAQGYVISRPLPEAELLVWLEGYQGGA